MVFWVANAASPCVTCVRRDFLDTHEHVLATQRLHFCLVLLTWQQSAHEVFGEERSALQHPLVVNPEHGDGRHVLHLPAQSIAAGPERLLAQGVDIRVV